MNATPRKYVAAAKPARSPTTPPPSAMTTSFRSNPDLLKNANAWSNERIDLCRSPSGISQTLTSTPDERSARRTLSPNRSNTLRFEINAARRALGPITLRPASPISPIRPAPILISYLISRAGTRTETVCTN